MPAPAPEDGSSQLRLFAALLELLHALSERAPLVVCLKDMHWADRSTRAFVAFLESPVGTVGCLTGPGEPLLEPLTGLPRERPAAALREALAEQVLSATADGRLRFRHELLREALHDDLLPG